MDREEKEKQEGDEGTKGDTEGKKNISHAGSQQTIPIQTDYVQEFSQLRV